MLKDMNSESKKRKLETRPSPQGSKKLKPNSPDKNLKKKKAEGKAPKKTATTTGVSVNVRPKALKIAQKKKKFGTSQKKQNTPVKRQKEDQKDLELTDGKNKGKKILD